MRKHIGSIAFVALMVSVPALAEAQRRAAPSGGAKHEFGIDVGLAYYDPDAGESGIRFATPLDVRVGFVTAKKLQWEGRVGILFDSKGTGTEGTHVVTLGVNGVYAMTPAGNRRGMYLTGGAGLNLVDFGAASGTGFALNGAIGWRKPYGNAALRYEVGLKYDGEVADGAVVLVPKTISIGGRIGLSFWH
jgi:hypothetical protein